LDIDHFKGVNDAYGHEVGDRVLQAVGGTLAANLRPDDVVCRFGAGEFVLLLWGSDPTGLSVACERLLALVRSSEVDLDAHVIVRVTASMGATIAGVGETPDAILRRADELLYRSKRAGRDRVTVDAGA
jgi:diguanylate cyclase (GGDEF)-like protein